jgi:hypothetical protein
MNQAVRSGFIYRFSPMICKRLCLFLAMALFTNCSGGGNRAVEEADGNCGAPLQSFDKAYSCVGQEVCIRGEAVGWSGEECAHVENKYVGSAIPLLSDWPDEIKGRIISVSGSLKWWRTQVQLFPATSPEKKAVDVNDPRVWGLMDISRIEAAQPLPTSSWHSLDITRLFHGHAPNVILRKYADSDVYEWTVSGDRVTAAWTDGRIEVWDARTGGSCGSLRVHLWPHAHLIKAIANHHDPLLVCYSQGDLDSADLGFISMTYDNPAVEGATIGECRDYGYRSQTVINNSSVQDLLGFTADDRQLLLAQRGFVSAVDPMSGDLIWPKKSFGYSQGLAALSDGRGFISFDAENIESKGCTLNRI